MNSTAIPKVEKAEEDFEGIGLQIYVQLFCLLSCIFLGHALVSFHSKLPVLPIRTRNHYANDIDYCSNNNSTGHMCGVIVILLLL